VDLVPYMLEKAAKLPYDKLLCHSLTNLPLPLADGAFDAIVVLGVLEYIPPTDVPALLLEVGRCLKVRGYLGLTAPKPPRTRSEQHRGTIYEDIEAHDAAVLEASFPHDWEVVTRSEMKGFRTVDDAKPVTVQYSTWIVRKV